MRVLLTLAVLVSAVYAAEPATVKTFDSEWIHGMGRQTFAGDAVEATAFLAETNDYAQALGVMATVALTIGAVGGCIGGVFLCCKFGAGVAGGREREQSYGRMTRLVNRFALIILAALCLLVMIIGLQQSTLIPAGEDYLKEKLLIEAEVVSGKYLALSSGLDATYVGETFLASRTFSQQYLSIPFLATSNTTVIEVAEGGQDNIDSIEGSRVAVLATVYVLGLIAVCIGCAAGILANPTLSVGAAMCGFLMFSLMWLLLTSHFVINVILADICFDIRQFEYQATGNVTHEFAAGESVPGAKGRMLQRTETLLYEWNQSPENKTTTPYGDFLLFDQFCHCPAYDNAQNVFIQVDSFLVGKTEYLFTQDPSYNCSGSATACCSASYQSGADYDVASCTSVTPDCSNLTLCRRLATDLNQHWDVRVRELRDCVWVEQVFTNALANSNDDCGDQDNCGSVCESVLSGTVGVWATSFVASFLFCGMSCAGILGYKRLPSSTDDAYF